MASRYLIGIDLGTTNSAVAYVDNAERRRGGQPTIHRFTIRQVVQPGEFEERETLPSFLYFPADNEEVVTAGQGAGTLREPLTGVYARDHGALVPGRQVASAKSWLCNPTVDRHAPILPWGHGEDEPGCSPVQASAHYLAFLRDAWNRSRASNGETPETERFERQTLVLTVPASFDEEARELTVAAARDAGLTEVTLVEEPLAAFYSWIASHARSFRRQIEDGDEILVCDVGGGTTDFTLIRASIERESDAASAGDRTRRDGQMRFERTAVGEHLLLGGDNLDLALARRVQAKLGDVRLTLRQQQALARLTSASKEQLLTDLGRDRVTIAVPAPGRSLVGGRLAADLSREEVIETLLEGFLPAVAANDLPARASRAGLREFGLPYATEPAITRHLAAFLTRARVARERSREDRRSSESPGTAMVRPDAVLFNGGFFTPEVARDAVVRTIDSWFKPADPSWALQVLTNRNPATAVASGAAYYAFVREHGGIRVAGGSARAYYVGLGTSAPTSEATEGEAAGVTAVCVLPRSTEEGTTLPLPDRLFTISTNRPVAFPLYSTTTRHDALGEVVTLDSGDLHQHAPLVTILRYGKKSRHADLPVRLSARFTEVGTLEIWCESAVSDHRWRLQFELRGAEQPADEGDLPAGIGPDEPGEDETGIVISDKAVDRATSLVREVFDGRLPADGTSLESLATEIESLLGYARQAWPLGVIRRLGDTLLQVAEGRRRGPRFEARWFNLTGFCLRPGFGATLDDWRMDQLRRIYPAGLTFARELQNQAEWLVLWQRVAGGLTAGQQQEIYQRHRTWLGLGGKKDGRRVSPQVEREGWRLFASLERIPASNRTSLGSQLLPRVERQRGNAALLWALGRLGARMPAYGPINTVVPATSVEQWIQALIDARGMPEGGSEAVQSAVVEMAARTGDAHRDIDDDLRARVVDWLVQSGAPAAEVERVRHYVPGAATDTLRLFGEALPEGLRLAE